MKRFTFEIVVEQTDEEMMALAAELYEHEFKKGYREE